MEGTATTALRARTPKPEMQYSLFEYLYRDASNYKAHGELLLLGGATSADIVEIRPHLDVGEYFVAELVGVPPLQGELYQYSGGPTEDDHVFHEFVDLRPATKSEVEALPLWGTLETLKSRLEASRRGGVQFATTRFG